MVEPEKPLKKKDQIRLDEETTKRLQAEFVGGRKLAMEEAQKIEANISLIKEWDNIQAKIDTYYQLAKRLQAQEQEELAEEKRNKPPIKAQQRKIMCNYLKYIDGEGAGKEKRAGDELMQEAKKKQKVEDNINTAEFKELMQIIPDEEEVVIDVIPLAVKAPKIIGWKIYKEGKKSYYQITRADENS
ncbi:hypothetical protein Tco_1562440 [Tanacetum coccineum]